MLITKRKQNTCKQVQMKQRREEEEKKLFEFPL